jgi:hypothetical protein
MALDGTYTLARLVATAVLNAIWQGLALTALTWAILHLSPRLSAATRHGIWLATLATVLALPFLGLAIPSSGDAIHATQAVPVEVSSGWLMVLFAGWAIGAAVMLGRLAWSYG